MAMQALFNQSKESENAKLMLLPVPLATVSESVRLTVRAPIPSEHVAESYP